MIRAVVVVAAVAGKETLVPTRTASDAVVGSAAIESRCCQRLIKVVSVNLTTVAFVAGVGDEEKTPFVDKVIVILGVSVTRLETDLRFPQNLFLNWQKAV